MYMSDISSKATYKASCNLDLLIKVLEKSTFLFVCLGFYVPLENFSYGNVTVTGGGLLNLTYTLSVL